MRHRRLYLSSGALALSAALAALPCGADEGSWPERRPIAAGMPAFRAPADPPGAGESPAPAIAEPEGPLTLDVVLALALAHSPDLIDASYGVRESEARARQDAKMPNPELDLRLYRVDSADPTSDPDDEGRLRVIVSERFELGGKRSRRVELADQESRSAGWEYESRRIDVATEARCRFAELLGAQRRVATWRGLVDFLEGLRSRVADLVASGALRAVEAHEVARQAGRARIELASAEADLGTARYALAATWGGAAPRFTEAVGDIEAPVALPPIESVLGLAHRSPAVARWEAEVARSEAQLSLARAQKVPDLRAGVGARWREDRNDPDYLLDFEIDLPLADRKKGDALEAKHAVARARAAQESVSARHGALVAESYYAVTAAAGRVESLETDVVPAARAIAESEARAIEVGGRGVADLIDARRDLARAEDELTRALVDRARERARLEGLVGGPFDGG